MKLDTLKSEDKYKVSVDTNHRILYITISGFFTDEDANYAKQQYWNAINQHFKGKRFSILCDATEYKPSTKSAQDILNQLTLDTVGENIAAWAIVSESFLSNSQIKRLMGETRFEFFDSRRAAELWVLDNSK